MPPSNAPPSQEDPPGVGLACSECGPADEAQHLADLAPGEAWLVCRSCLDRFAEEALVAELRRRRVPATTIMMFMGAGSHPSLEGSFIKEGTFLYTESVNMRALRVIGYIRCSTQEQASEGMSLDAQRSRIAAWCDATGAELVETIEDAAISGGKALVERPGGHRIAALLDARKPNVDAVVVLRLDRLGRDAAETLALLRRFRTGKVGLVSITDRIDLGTPQGRAMAQMGAVFAELERALIGQRTSEALAELRRQGRAYGPTPFGWVAVGGLLEVNPEEQGVLERIRFLRQAKLSYDRVARVLNEDGVKAKRASRWSAMAVRSVLLTAERLPSVSGAG